MSKPLTLSAAVSVAAMAIFAVFAAHSLQPAGATDAPTGISAPALKVLLPDS